MFVHMWLNAGTCSRVSLCKLTVCESVSGSCFRYVYVDDEIKCKHTESVLQYDLQYLHLVLVLNSWS